jgi:hypothetical protein
MSIPKTLEVGLNLAIVSAQVEHAQQHDGAAQVESFCAAVDLIENRYCAKISDATPKQRAAITSLCERAKAAATKAGRVIVPPAV